MKPSYIRFHILKYTVDNQVTQLVIFKEINSRGTTVHSQLSFRHYARIAIRLENGVDT